MSNEFSPAFIAELDEEAEASAEGVTRYSSDSEIELAYAELSFRVIYQSNNFFLPQLRDIIKEREVINVRPEYQRRLRWNNKKKSLLIESLLLNIPVPPIYLYESDLARYEVMDGQQRLNAVYEYIENNFGLIGLGHLHFLNGRRYNSLPPKLKRGLDRASISAIVLLRETRSSEDDPFMVRKYVFERLNTGGEKLNAQELRNSIFRGSLNDLIVSLARNPVFCDIFGIPEYTETDESEFYENPERQRNTLYRAMGDCQIVLRFLAFRDEANIRGAVQDILDRYMRANLNPSEGELRQLRELFESTIGTCHAIFGENVFRLPADEQGRRRLSIPLYDATMVAAASHISDAPRLLEKRKEIRADMDALVAADIDLFTARGNTAQSIRDRILAVDRLFSSKCIE